MFSFIDRSRMTGIERLRPKQGRRIAYGCMLSLLLLLSGACANYKFMRAFEPLLDKDLAIDKQYRDFEASQPGGYWQENLSILKGMVDAKTEILQSLKTMTPNKENEDLYHTLVEDLNNSIAYLNLEMNYFVKSTEYGAWFPHLVQGFDNATPEAKKGFLNAQREVLRVQAEMTAAAEKCNATQERLAQLLQQKDLRRNYQPLKYAKYDKEQVGYRIK